MPPYVGFRRRWGVSGHARHKNLWGVSGHAPRPNRRNALHTPPSFRRQSCIYCVKLKNEHMASRVGQPQVNEGLFTRLANPLFVRIDRHCVFSAGRLCGPLSTEIALVPLKIRASHARRLVTPDNFLYPIRGVRHPLHRIRHLFVSLHRAPYRNDDHDAGYNHCCVYQKGNERERSRPPCISEI
jgi:hypothetical protein